MTHQYNVTRSSTRCLYC